MIDSRGLVVYNVFNLIIRSDTCWLVYLLHTCNYAFRLLLQASTQRPHSINEVMPMIGARFYAQLETTQMKNDLLENELSKELENGRLFRLLCKLNTITERAEYVFSFHH